jgi:hypothetical protein
MRFKTRLFACASALTLTGSMLVVAAPVAHAAPTVIGSCVGQVGLTHYSSSGVSTALTDQTQVGIAIRTRVLIDHSVGMYAVGNCDGIVRPGDESNPAGGPVSSPLRQTGGAVSGAFVGNVSCAFSPDADAADANAAARWPAQGKITWRLDQATPTGTPVNYLIQAYVTLLRLNTGPYAPDGVDVGGVVTKGVNYGAIVSGTIWMDPVTQTGNNAAMYHTGWEIDLPNAIGCFDDVADNASVANEMFGGGAGSSTSLLGTGGVPGITFTLG